MTDEPTPSTDAAQIEREEYEEATNECDRIALPERPKDAWELCRELERELAAAREQWRMSSVCRELRAELDRERALADRLAEVLRLYDADTLAGETMQWVPEHDKALAAWKEARHGTD